MSANPPFAKQVRLEFIGEIHPDFKTFVAAHSELQQITYFRGNIPHEDLLQLYGSSSLLLLVLTGYKDGEGFLPGKLFEYLATGLPILGVGPVQGDAAALLKETQAGIMVASEDGKGIRESLRAGYVDWQKSARLNVDRGRVMDFSRRKITGQLVKILEEQVSKSPSTSR